MISYVQGDPHILKVAGRRSMPQNCDQAWLHEYTEVVLRPYTIWDLGFLLVHLEVIIQDCSSYEPGVLPQIQT